VVDRHEITHGGLPAAGQARRPSFTRPPDTGCERGHGSGAAGMAAAACPAGRPPPVARLPADRAAPGAPAPAPAAAADQAGRGWHGAPPAHRPRCPRPRWPCPAAIPRPDTAGLPCSASARFLLSVARNKFHRTRRRSGNGYSRVPACRSATGCRSHPWRYRRQIGPRKPCRSGALYDAPFGLDAGVAVACALPAAFQLVPSLAARLSRSAWLLCGLAGSSAIIIIVQ